MSAGTRKVVEVAAAVITRLDGTFLLGQRAEGTFYPGYWEFPGGKLEAGESASEALCRELREELEIEAQATWPWLMREHHYEHAHVRLHFFEVPHWQGEPQSHVHAALAWQRADALDVSPMLPANGPILKALSLPRWMAITQAADMGVAAQLDALDAALARGLRCVQIREPKMDAGQLAGFAREVRARCREAGAMVLLNGPVELAQACALDGVHCAERTLGELSQRPDLEWVGASCHSRESLQRAATLDFDFAVLGAVKPTPTHPDQPGMGWQQFHALTRELPMPVFAIGGLTMCDMDEARGAGAHGIACIRAAWD